MTPEQSSIIDRILAEDQRHFRILGRAGTGKTYTLQRLIRALHGDGCWNACVTPTGAAAVRVETEIDGKMVFAKTLQGYLGFRNPDEEADMDAQGNLIPLKFDNYLAERSWQFRRNVLPSKHVNAEVAKLHTLIIEECSMVDADMFERISEAFQAIRQDDRPFGGVRVVLVGDFKQLRPIMGNFLFTSELYREMEFEPLKLETIMRTDHPQYTDFQRDIAVPDGTFFAAQPFVQSRWTSDATLGDHTYEYTHLFDLNRDALAWNQRAITRLFPSAQLREYPLYDTAREDNDPRKVALCEGMRVMVTANAKGLACVNGDIGTIVRFVDEQISIPDQPQLIVKPTPVVRLHRNDQEVTVPWKVRKQYRKGGVTHHIQLPCRPGYAATVHKFQGLTADGIVIRSKRNEHGKQFVAATRCRNPDSLLFHKDDMGPASRTTFDPQTPSIDF